MADNKVIAALLGDQFAQFQKLAQLATEQPATRPYVEAQMATLLRTMTPAQRQALRRALLSTTKEAK